MTKIDFQTRMQKELVERAMTLLGELYAAGLGVPQPGPRPGRPSDG